MNFNWELYGLLNPDLALAGIVGPGHLTRHYINNGRREGRPIMFNQAYPNFKWEIYSALNPDLNLDKQSNAELHYLTKGKYSNLAFTIQQVYPSYNRDELKNKFRKNFVNLNDKEIDLLILNNKELYLGNQINYLEKINQIIYTSNSDYVSVKNNSNTDKAIFITVDKDSVIPFICLVKSIINTNNVSHYVFNILTDYDSISNVTAVMNGLFSQTNFNIKEFNYADLNPIYDFIYNNSIKSKMHYAKLFYENYFEEIYYVSIDVNTIIYSDLTPFFNFDINNEDHIINVVKNINFMYACTISRHKTRRILNNFRIDPNSFGFNSFIYSINNKYFKLNNHLNQIIKLMDNESTTFNNGLQSIFNVYFYHIAKTFNPILFRKTAAIHYSDWAYFDLSNTEVFKKNQKKIKSIHFNSLDKHYNTNSKHYELFLNVIKTINL
jgi:lipopolysaccharide biosynthesis glycosyltransferase